MLEHKRDCLASKYHQISVKGCPYEVILKIAELGKNLVTIENYNADATIDNPRQMKIGLKNNRSFEVDVKSISCNFQIEKASLFSLLEGFNNPSFYAVFHDKSIKLIASNLDDLPRYKALDNFGWNLEILTPNNSIEYAFFATPNKDIADKIEGILSKTSSHQI